MGAIGRERKEWDCVGTYLATPHTTMQARSPPPPSNQLPFPSASMEAGQQGCKLHTTTHACAHTPPHPTLYHKHAPWFIPRASSQKL